MHAAEPLQLFHHALPKPASCRAGHVARGHSTERFVFVYFVFSSLVVAGALMHGEFCLAALSFRLNTRVSPVPHWLSLTISLQWMWSVLFKINVLQPKKIQWIMFYFLLKTLLLVFLILFHFSLFCGFNLILLMIRVFMVYLIGTDTLHIDTDMWENSHPMEVSECLWRMLICNIRPERGFYENKKLNTKEYHKKIT